MKQKVAIAKNSIFKKIIVLLCLSVLAIVVVSVKYRYLLIHDSPSHGLAYYFAKQEGEVSADGRGYPVFVVYSYDGNKTKKLFTVGKKGEYVRDNFLFVESKGKIIVNLENKLLLYSIDSKKTQGIQFGKEEVIGSVAASSNEDEFILNVRDDGSANVKYNKTIAIDIDTLTQKILYEDNNVNDFETEYWILVPDFKFTQEQMLVRIAPIEGWPLYGVMNLTSQKLTKLNLKDGLVNRNSLFIASADDLPPYGGCYFPQKFDIRLYDLKTNTVEIVFTKNNAVPKLIDWDSSGNKLLYEVQTYVPETECTGNGRLSEKVETYVYDVKTHKTNKITSAEEQRAIWYPEKYSLYKKFGREIIYFGNIER